MKKITLFRRLCAVTMGLLLSTTWVMADAIELPCERVDFAKRTEFLISNETTGTKGLELNSGDAYYGLGSCNNGNYCILQVNNTTEQGYLFAMQMKEGGGNSGTVKFTLTDISDDSKTYTVGAFSCPSTNNELRDYVGELAKLPVGTYNMRIDFTASGTWAPNLYNLAIVAKGDFATYNTRLISPTTVNLEKALKTQSFTTKSNEISSTRNGYDVAYIVYCGEAGTYSVDFDASAVDTGVSIDATVFNADGTPGGTANNEIANSNDSQDWNQYATYHAEDLTLVEGYNVVRFKFNKSDGTSLTWAVANVKNVTLTKTSPINTIPSNSFAMDLGVRADRTNTKFGSTLVDANQRNSYFIYRVNVTEAGKYTLSIDSECDQPNTKQPSFTVLVTDANGQETSQTFTITNPGEDIKQTETFTTDPIDLPVGICTIKISFASATGNLWTTNLKDMKVNTFAYNLEISDNEDFAPLYDECASATYYTNITANSYRTICLPFAPDEESLSAYNFYELAASTINGDEGSVTFNMVNSPEANKPYIYSLKEGAEEGTPITGGATANLTAAEAGTIEITGWQMVGSFKNETVDCSDKAVYALGENGEKLIKYTGALTVPPYRAYIMGTSSEQYRLQRLTVRISTPTGIKQISASDVEGLLPATIYDLMGRPVQNPQKGHLYIQGGKKVIY